MPQPDVAVATSLVVIVLGTLATLLLRSRRQIWALVPLAMLAVLAVWTVPPTGTVTIVGRPTAEAVCAGSAPRVCLWPEQEAEDGPEMRSALATAYPKAVALGLRAQPVIAVAGYDDGESAIRVGVTGDPDAVITDLAHQLVAQWSRCQWFDGPDQPADLGLYERAQQSAAYGAAVLLGADPIAALPSVHVVTGRDWTTGPTLDAVATRNWLGVRDEADARAVVARWTSSALEARCTSPVG